jgi:sugar/nucleoside kinase (ribokinase family)
MRIERLIFIGHTSMDLVENVNGSREQAGGAALYAAVAARTLFNDVRLVTAIGRDYKFKEALRGFNPSGIRIFDMPSTRFHIVYDENWNARYIKAQMGAGARIGTRILPRGWITDGSAVHFSPMSPGKVLKMSEGIRKRYADCLISVNTWMEYIKKSKNREYLLKLAEISDFFIINESEAKGLARTSSISIALRKIEARNLVITLGELGAIIKDEEGRVHMVPALSFGALKTVDVTGAGDSWCGAFLASYSLTEDLLKAVSTASIISGVKCSGWGLDAIIGLRFRDPDEVVDYVLSIKEGREQCKLFDFL